MSFFFEFPEYFCYDLLSEWFNLKDIGQLDSAVCNNAKRVSLLNFLSNSAVVLSINVPDSSKKTMMFRNDRFMCWMSCRLLTFNQVTFFCSNFVLFDGQLKYNVNLSRIQSLSLFASNNRVSEVTVSRLFNSCPCLHKFEVIETFSLNSTFVLHFNPLILQQLTVFKIKRSTGLTLSSLQYLASSCRNLVEFEVTTNDNDTNLEHAIISLISHNPHLQIIHISTTTAHSYFNNHYTDRLLDTITDTCEDLKELVLLNCSKITLPSLHRLLSKHIKSLTTVEVHHSDRQLGSFTYTAYTKCSCVSFDGDFHHNETHDNQITWYEIFSTLPPLHSVSLTSCSGISDDLLRCIGAKCGPLLERLCVVKCVNGYIVCEEMECELRRVCGNLTHFVYM
jgi:hypothetical protein